MSEIESLLERYQGECREWLAIRDELVTGGGAPNARDVSRAQQTRAARDGRALLTPFELDRLTRHVPCRVGMSTRAVTALSNLLGCEPLTVLLADKENLAAQLRTVVGEPADLYGRLRSKVRGCGTKTAREICRTLGFAPSKTEPIRHTMRLNGLEVTASQLMPRLLASIRTAILSAPLDGSEPFVSISVSVELGETPEKDS